MSESKFCLLMIVRDESPIITRALNSLKNIFDSYIISDTGSTDDTIDVGGDYGEKPQGGEGGEYDDF